MGKLFRLKINNKQSYSFMWNDDQLTILLKIIREAGSAILSVYSDNSNFRIRYKDDYSPITRADRLANRTIVRALKKLPVNFPILSEESEEPPYRERESWTDYWLIDPLDGTKEFIKQNGEFSVNIAHIRNGSPEMGAVHAPVTGVTYLGKKGLGAWRVDRDDVTREIHARRMQNSSSAIKVLTSRNHRNDSLDNLLKDISTKVGDAEVVAMGSSLKICLLAEGKADLYLRQTPTCEWDTAAAHAVLAGSGGEIFDANSQILKYNQKSSLLNPNFFAVADPNFDWGKLLKIK